MLKRVSLTLVAIGLVTASMVAQAALITFNATGNANVSGYVQFDDSTFDGTASQFLSNTAITDLMMTVFGQNYSLADVAVADGTIMDSSGLIPIIVNGAGNLADNGVQAIAFFPDGFGGTTSDGDASLAIGPTGSTARTSFYAVRWEAAARVPEPATLVLLGLGLAGLAAARRRKQ